MPRDSGGNYTLDPSNPVVANTPILDTWANPTMTDIATALTDSLSRSGKGGMQVPMKVTDGTAAAPGLAFNGETTSGLYRGPSGVGISALGVGVATFLNTQITFFKQLLISTVADNVKAIFRGHTTQTANILEIQNSAGTVLNGFGPTGALLLVSGVTVTRQVFLTGSGNWTKPAGLRFAVVRLIGGGGSGGGSAVTTSVQASAGAGGGAGGYIEALYSAASLGATEPYSVGAGGAIVIGTAGNAGANTTFRIAGATQLIATGGAGGGSGSAAANAQGSIGGLGSVTTAPVGFGVAGGDGSNGTALVVGTITRGWGGDGGNSAFGGGGRGVTVNGSAGAGEDAAVNSGGGGGGGASAGNSGTSIGGGGGRGIIIIDEYS